MNDGERVFHVPFMLELHLSGAGGDGANPQKLAYTISEAAELLSYSDDTVRRMIDAGELGTIGERGRKRITRAELERYTVERLSRVGEGKWQGERASRTRSRTTRGGLSDGSKR